jgi:sporulation protein YlmC with PRC-barrel domain
MRLSDLLTAEVVDEHGKRVGHVRDVAFVRDGPSIEGFGPAYRLESLIIGRGSLGARLGLDREDIRSPWLLRLIFGRHRPRTIPWEDVAAVEDQRIRVRTSGE